MLQKSKILIIAPSWLGDTIMSHSLLQLLAAKDNVLHVMATSWVQDILYRMPEVNCVIPSPFEHGVFDWYLRKKVAQRLKQENYKQVILLTNSWKSALVPYLANIPLRTGWLGEYRWLLLNDIKYFSSQKLKLMVQRFNLLAYASNTSVLDIALPEPKLNIDFKLQQNLLNKFSLTKKPQQKIVAIAVGAAYGPSKRWPLIYYINIISYLLERDFQVYLFGTKTELNAHNIMQQHFTCHGKVYNLHNFINKLNLLETVDLLGMADLFIGNDSGLLHLAAALNIAVIGIYGSTSSKFAPPLTKKSKIFDLEFDCKPCRQRECPLNNLQCLHNITPLTVITAIKELLNIK